MTETKSRGGRKPFVGPGPDSDDARALRFIGENLFGPTWQTALAESIRRLLPEDAKLDPAMIRIWASGRRAVSPWVWPALAQVERRRRGEMADAQRAIEDMLKRKGTAAVEAFERRRSDPTDDVE